MPRRVYRVCRASHGALSGEGARLAGGRWNSPGRPVIYTAESISLAVLENLVHMSRADFPSGYTVVTALVPDELTILDDTWLRLRFGKTDYKTAGNGWLDSRASAVLKVPSAVVPFECNFLLNPAHPDFSRITVESTLPFRFDERLFGG